MPVFWTEAARTTEITAIAFAGVGSPLKETDWVVSILNTAKRMPAQTGIIEGTAIARNISPDPASISPVLPAPKGRRKQGMHKEGRSYTKADNVSQTVEFLAYRGIGFQKPRRKTIKEIENHCSKYKP